MSDLVLITGGAGFIGSHLSERLLSKGYRVRVLDNLSFGREEWLPKDVEFIRGDIQDIADCRRACDGVSGLFHTAAMSRAGPSLEAIESCTQQNITGTQNILIAARDAGVRKVIYSGSSTFYGNQSVPHRENMQGEFLNFYSLSKYVGEEYVRLFDRAFGLQMVVLRYFNVYGPRQPETGAYALVLGIFLKAWRDGRPLEIHGSGDQRRDFIHVRDVADCNIAAYECAHHDVVLNVGSGVNVSIKSLADLISNNQAFAPRRPGDAMQTLADVSATNRLLNWQPKISLAEGLAELKDLILREAGDK